MLVLRQSVPCTIFQTNAPLVNVALMPEDLVTWNIDEDKEVKQQYEIFLSDLRLMRRTLDDSVDKFQKVMKRMGEKIRDVTRTAPPTVKDTAPQE